MTGDETSLRPARSARQRLGALDRRVFTIAVASFVRSSGRSASWLFLPLILYIGYGLSLIQVGLLVSALVPLSVLVNLYGGAAADRYGRRSFVVWPPLGSALTFFALYELWHQGIVVLMSLWAVIVVLTNLQQPAQNAMMGDVTQQGDRSVAFGIQRVFANAGFALAPAVGGLLATSFGLSIVFLMAAITSAGEGIVLVSFLKETFRGTARDGPSGEGTSESSGQRWAARIRAPFRDRFLLTFGILGFCLTLATQQFGTPLSLFMATVQHLPYSEIGLVYSLNGVVVVGLQIPISWGIRRRQLLWMGVGILLYGAAFLVFDLSPGFMVNLGAIFVLTLGEDITSPTQNAVLSGLSGRSRRGSYFAAYNVFTSSAQAIAPSLGALLLGFGYHVLWLPFSLLTVAVAIGYAWLHHRDHEPPSAPPEEGRPGAASNPVTPATTVTGAKHTGFGHSGP